MIHNKIGIDVNISVFILVRQKNLITAYQLKMFELNPIPVYASLRDPAEQDRENGF